MSDWKVVENSDAEILAMDSLDTRTTAVIDQRYAEDIKNAQKGVDSTASVKIIAKDGVVAPNYLEYEVNGSKNNLVMFSEIHYPIGWDAYLDGKLVPHVRANYVLRALEVPAGKHKVEFKFEPTAYKNGENISLASSVLLLLLFATAAFVELKKKA
ncbi:MAG: YfhO family protein [Bacteroidetes bacterium]|nr:YfhO family protein [Bacteroidota bacterium]